MPAAKFLDPATGQWKSLGTVGYDSTPIGGVITWTRKTLPITGEYVMADGATFSETAYPDACAVAAVEVAAGNTLWTISGIAPNRTFTVPDLRDRFLYGAGTKLFGVRSQTNPALPNPGEETHLQIPGEAAIRAHAHPATGGGESVFDSEANPGLGGNAAYIEAANGWSGLGTHTYPAPTIQNATAANAATATNNMPPYVVLGFIVKLKAVSVQGGVIQGPQGVAGGAYATFVIGDAVATSFTVAHGMNTEVTATVRRSAAPKDEITCDIEYTDLNTVTIRTFPMVPAAGELTVVVRASGTQSTLNVTMDSWHTVGAAGEPAFQNSWVNIGGAVATAGFRKYPDGKVRLRGGIKNGSALGIPIFTLPVGYRPLADMDFAVASAGAFGRVYIEASTGSVYANNGSTITFYLNGIEFDTEGVLQTASVAAQPLDPIHVVGAAGEPAFQNSWVNYGSGYQNASFRKDPFGKVRIRGLITGGVASSSVPGTGVAFTLPVGYRPASHVTASGSLGGTPVQRLDVMPTGEVVMYSAGGGNPMALDLIEFDTDSVSAYASGIIGPPKVTVLPASPVDGQECYFVADAANGILWHLRYNAASASPYKWEVIGGSPLRAEVQTGETTASGTYVALATAGPSVTVPLAGDYAVAIESNQSHTAASAFTGHSYDLGASAAVDADFARMNSSVASQVIHGARERVKTGLAAGAAIVSKYRTSGATATFSERGMRVMPVRVG